MPLIPLALHLPPLLLRLLLLVLPVPPFVPSPTSPFPLDLPRGSRKHPSNRPCPARRPRPFAVNAHLAPPIRRQPLPYPDPAPASLRQPRTHPKPSQNAPGPAPRVIPGSSPGIQSSSPNPPPTRPKAPRAARRVFWKKLLFTRRTPNLPRRRPHPLSCGPSHPPAGPGSRLTLRSAVVAGTLLGLCAVGPASLSRASQPAPSAASAPPPATRRSAQKTRQKLSLASPPLWGRAGEREFPPKSPHAFPAPALPTLRP